MKKEQRKKGSKKKPDVKTVPEAQEATSESREVISPIIFYKGINPIITYSEDEVAALRPIWERECRNAVKNWLGENEVDQMQKDSKKEVSSDVLEEKPREKNSQVARAVESGEMVEAAIIEDESCNHIIETHLSYPQPTSLAGYSEQQLPYIVNSVPTMIPEVGYFITPFESNYDFRNQLAMFNPSFHFDGDTSLPNSSLGNFTLTPIKRRIFIDRFGNEIPERQEILVRIQIEGQEPNLFTVHPKDLKRLGTIISEKFVFAYLNAGIKNVDKKLNIKFRNDLKQAETERVFVDFGWQTIDGYPVYAQDALNPSPYGVFKTGRVLPCIDTVTPGQVGDIVMKAFRLYKDPKVIHVIQLFSMLGISFQAFNQAGFPPRFLLFIDGPTGSMKTTLAEIMLVQTRDEEGYGNMRRFQDTLASLEIGFAQNGRDTVTLVDDYSPPKTPYEEHEKADKIELLLRMAGDGLSKGRSNSQLEDHRGQRVEGVVAVTGELICTGTSSKLRCFFCPMEKGKVDLNILGEFQHNSSLYPTFLNHYTFYLRRNWNAVVEYFRGEIENERKSVKEIIYEPRIVDSAVVLRLQASILGDFLIRYCGREVSEVNSLINIMKESVLQIAVQSEARSMDVPLVERIIRSINTLLLDGSYRIIGSKPNETNFSEIDGYIEKEYIFFRPDKFYSKISRSLAAQGIKLSIDCDQIVELLIQEGVAVPSLNGHNGNKQKTTKLTRVNIGKQLRVQFIKLRRDRLDNYKTNE